MEDPINVTRLMCTPHGSYTIVEFPYLSEGCYTDTVDKDSTNRKLHRFCRTPFTTIYCTLAVLCSHEPDCSPYVYKPEFKAQGIA